ncbi:carbonic anhydrase [Dolichospermum flos-aquae]|uniref:Carbonic anhydrase n=1 Tax=Dolichospermum flos-aquae LEGE 04289 TaxID=1828708 RepID=A0ACC5Q001_DOLFA|nr:carbonic anhydrase [Dolichospermum flos-aquae]MBE9218209.1 carbonic anhydrase [Dolichospermum flos-aquae LEGE 04289]
MKKTINQCLCCSSRRHFLSSFLPAAVAFTVLQSATPAQAEVNQAQALVISCIDFRFLRAEYSFLNNKNLTDKYDLTALAGASLALTGFPHKSDAQAFWDQLDISYKLHHIHKVIIIDHQDCGAYAMMIDPNLSKDPQRELQIHTDYLNQAYSSIRNHYSDLQVELYFATLNQREFQQIFPKLEK